MIGVAALVIGAPVGVREWRRLRRPSTADIERLLRSRLADRNLAPDAIPQFAAEYYRRYGAFVMSRREKQTLGGLWEFGAFRPLFSDARTEKLLETERRMISQFLRSTDYFARQADVPARYIAFANPYETTCTNPFARFNL
jgi:hypothetical protein